MSKEEKKRFLQFLAMIKHMSRKNRTAPFLNRTAGKLGLPTLELIRADRNTIIV